MITKTKDILTSMIIMTVMSAMTTTNENGGDYDDCDYDVVEYDDGHAEN